MVEKAEWEFGKGRPKGARNRATRSLETLLDQNMADVVEAMIVAAKAGDAAAGRLVISLRRAPARDRALALQLPAIGSPADATKVATAIAQEMARGKVTPIEARDALDVLERLVRVGQAAELEERLATLEKLALKSAAAGKLSWGEL